MKYSFTYIDSVAQKHCVMFNLLQFRNVMELIVDSGLEDFGDCQGRAWCGTCVVEVLESAFTDVKTKEEIRCVEPHLNSNKKNIRLTCQMDLTEELNDAILKFTEGDLD